MLGSGVIEIVATVLAPFVIRMGIFEETLYTYAP